MGANHGDEPCTFYERPVDRGSIDICCSHCWATGVFFKHRKQVAAPQQNLPITCNEIDLPNHSGDCVESFGPGHPFWDDRTYAAIDGPGGILDGTWRYQTSSMSTEPPCAREGGFKGTIKTDATVAICC